MTRIYYIETQKAIKKEHIKYNYTTRMQTDLHV